MAKRVRSIRKEVTKENGNAWKNPVETFQSLEFSGDDPAITFAEWG